MRGSREETVGPGPPWKSQVFIGNKHPLQKKMQIMELTVGLHSYLQYIVTPLKIYTFQYKQNNNLQK